MSTTSTTRAWSLWITGAAIANLLIGGFFVAMGLHVALAGAEAINELVEAQGELSKIVAKAPGLKAADAKKVDAGLEAGAGGLGAFIGASVGLIAVSFMIPGIPFLLLGLGILMRWNVARFFAILGAVPLGLLGLGLLGLGFAATEPLYVGLTLLGYSFLMFFCLLGRNASQEFNGVPAGRIIARVEGDTEGAPAASRRMPRVLLTAIVLLIAAGAGFAVYSYQTRRGSPPPLTVEQKEKLKRQERVTALIVAAEKGQLSEVMDLIKKGANPNDKGEQGETALMKAAARGNINVVTFLLASGAQPNERDENGETALMKAAAAGNESVVECLLGLGNFRQEMAALAGQVSNALKSIPKLPDGGKFPDIGKLPGGDFAWTMPKAEIDARDRRGETAFMKAFLSGHHSIAVVLLKQGARGLSVDKDGNDIRLLAASRGKVELLRNGILKLANPNDMYFPNGDRNPEQGHSLGGKLAEVNHFGQEPWMLAAAQGQVDAMLLLMPASATPEQLNRKDRSGKTAYELALAGGHKDLAEELRRRLNMPLHADTIKVLQAGPVDSIALIEAVKKSDLSAVQALLPQGSRTFHGTDTLGLTALMHAAAAGEPRIVLLLVNHANREMPDYLVFRDRAGRTAIMHAAANGHADALDALLSIGLASAWNRGRINWWVALEMRDKDGKTAADLARAAGHRGALDKMDAFAQRLLNAANGDPATRTALAQLAEAGDLGGVEALLARGADPLAGTISPLMTAAGQGHILVVETLLNAHDGSPSTLQQFMDRSAGFSFDGANQTWTARSMAERKKYVEIIALLDKYRSGQAGIGARPLFPAIRTANVAEVQKLLATKPNLASADPSGRTALHLAVEKGAGDIVKMLLDAGADPRAKDRAGRTPAQLALQPTTGTPQLAVIRAFLQAGVDLGTTKLTDGQPLLHRAAAANDEEMVRLLVSFKADVNEKDSKGQTPLHLAVSSKIIRHLLEAGADLKIARPGGAPLLHKAVSDGDTELVQLLITHKASLAQKDTQGRTAWQLACGADGVSGPPAKIAKLLIDAGADVNTPRTDGHLPLHLASATGNLDLMQVLLQAKVRVDEKDKKGYLAIHRATSIKAVELLLEAGANPTIPLPDGSTLLQNAIAKAGGSAAHREILGLLLKRKDYDANSTDGDGTPLVTWAIRNRHFDIATALVERGARLDARDKAGVTALEDLANRINSEAAAMALFRAVLSDKRLKPDAAVVGKEPLVAWLARHAPLSTAKLAIDAGGNPREIGPIVLQRLAAAPDDGRALTLELLQRKLLDPNSTLSDGRPLLLFAASRSDHELMQALLEQGARLDSLGSDAPKLLQSALERSSSDAKSLVLLKTLMQARSFDPNGRTASGQLFLHWAVATGRYEAARMLLDRGADLYARDQNNQTVLQIAQSQGNTKMQTLLLLARGAEINAATPDGQTFLHWAARGGHTDLIAELLGRKANIDCAAMDGATPLHAAVRGNQAIAVKLLLEKGADANRADKQGITPFWDAVAQGHAEVAGLLLAAKADWKTAPKGNDSAVNIAAQRDAKLLLALLENGVDVNFKGLNGRTPIFAAAEANRAETFKVLLEKKADVTLTNAEGRTVLHHLAAAGQQTLAFQVLNQGARPNVADGRGRTPLLEAVSAGHADLMELLLDHKANLETAGADGETPLLVAVRRGHRNLALSLLRRGANVNVKSKDDTTPLFAAVESNATDLVRRFLEKGANPNSKHRDGRFPLHVAINNDNLDMVQTLAARKADLAVTDANGHTPLMEAMRQGRVPIARELILGGSDMKKPFPDGTTLGHAAVRTNNVELVRAALDKGVDPNAKDKAGVTLLAQAVMNGALDVTALLLDRKADPDAAPENGDAPLMNACLNGRRELVELLIQRGAKVNITNKEGMTPLAAAAQANSTELVRIFLARGGDANAKTRDGRPLVTTAVAHGNIDMMRMLLEKRPDLAAVDSSGVTPLIMAIANNRLDFARELVQAGADAKKATSDGSSPLHYAVRTNNRDFVQLVLDRAPDVNAADKQGRTPLLDAVALGSIEVTTLLLDRKADSNRLAENGMGALYHAVQMNRRELVELLVNKGAHVRLKQKTDFTPLLAAAQANSLDLARYLLDRDAEPTGKDTEGRTPLHFAVLNDNLDLVRALLTRKADLERANNQGRTPLHDAAENSRTNHVKELLQAGASVRVQDKEKRTPLHLAARTGNRDVVQALLDHQAEVNVRDAAGRTPLLESAGQGSTEVIGMLLQRKADLELATDEGETPLLVAASTGRKEAVDTLLKAGARVRARNKQGGTVLHRAIAAGNAELVKTLVDKGADTQVRDADDVTLLMLAAQGGQVEMVQSLLKAKIDVNARAKDGTTALLRAARNGVSSDVLRALRDNGADASLADERGETPLLAAAQRNSTDAVRILLEQGDKAKLVRVATKDGQTPLHHAARFGNRDMAGLVLDAKADIEAVDELGRTPLMQAIVAGDAGLIRLLVDRGANVNARDKASTTVLHMTIQHARLEVVPHLLAKGADINAVDDRGQPVMVGAIASGDINRVRFLLENSADKIKLDALAQNGANLFHMAARFGNPDILRYFLEKGANPNAKDKNGSTAIHHALLGNRTDNARFLMEINPNAKQSLVGEQIPAEFLNALFKEPSLSALLDGAATLHQLGGDVRPILRKQLTTNLKNLSAAERINRAALLAHLAGDDDLPVCVPILREGLAEKDAALRQTCLQTLVALGPLAKDAVALLARQLDDTSPRTRLLATRALANLSTDATPARQALENRLKDDDVGVRELARIALEMSNMDPPAGHVEFRGYLAPSDPIDRVRRGSYHVVHLVRMTAGKTYVIDLISGWDNYLRLETANCQQIAENDDGGGYPNARITIQAPQDGWYRVIVTSVSNNTSGQYTLKIQQK